MLHTWREGEVSNSNEPEVQKTAHVENVYEGLNVKNDEGLNACSKVYLLKEYFCKMYPTCVSSKLCEFIHQEKQKTPQN